MQFTNKVYYFSPGMKWLAVVIAGAGIYSLFHGYFVWSFLAILSSIIISTTHYITLVDIDKKYFDDFIWFLGLRLNRDKKQFRSLKKIIITKENHSKLIQTRAQSRTINWTDYTATLITDMNELTLLTRTSKAELMNGIREWALALNTMVEDHTSSLPYPVQFKV